MLIFLILLSRTRDDSYHLKQEHCTWRHLDFIKCEMRQVLITILVSHAFGGGIWSVQGEPYIGVATVPQSCHTCKNNVVGHFHQALSAACYADRTAALLGLEITHHFNLRAISRSTVKCLLMDTQSFRYTRVTSNESAEHCSLKEPIYLKDTDKAPRGVEALSNSRSA